MVHKSINRSNSVAAFDRVERGFSSRTHHFVVDNVGGVCTMERIPQQSAAAHGAGGKSNERHARERLYGTRLRLLYRAGCRRQRG
jgi:hypothetical protein